MQGTSGWSLVKELRSHMSLDTTKKKKIAEKEVENIQ